MFINKKDFTFETGFEAFQLALKYKALGSDFKAIEILQESIDALHTTKKTLELTLLSILEEELDKLQNTKRKQ